jgi:hypothetical protein
MCNLLSLLLEMHNDSGASEGRPVSGEACHCLSSALYLPKYSLVSSVKALPHKLEGCG